MTELIEKFYTSFSNLDAESMATCYHPDVVFYDPAFGELKGERASAMWKMLCSSQKGQEFIVTFSEVITNDNSGSAKWEAIYNFSKTKRKVHNKITASFEFKDGLIIKHTDHFNLHSWSKQALGLSGTLIGWTGYFKKKLQGQTNGMLNKFMAKNKN